MTCLHGAVIVLLLSTLSAYKTHAQTLLHDDFNDNVLDAAKWMTDTPSGSIAETNQHLEFRNRGYLTTFNEFDPISFSGLDISGTWTNVAGNDFAEIVTRADAIPSGDFNAVGNGILFQLRSTPNSQVGSMLIREYVDGVHSLLADQSIPFTTGDTIDFRVQDDGNNLSFSVLPQGASDPVVMTASTNRTYSTNHVVFHNRENNNGLNTLSQLDEVMINSLEPGPPVQKVFLALGTPAPRYGPSNYDLIFQTDKIRRTLIGETMVPADADDFNFGIVLVELQRIFNGYNVEFVTEGSQEDATVVYYTHEDFGSRGIADFDPGNDDSTDEAVISIERIRTFGNHSNTDAAAAKLFALDIAETTAHEIGHTFGLSHIRADLPVGELPESEPIMDDLLTSKFSFRNRPGFQNSPMPVYEGEQNTGLTQNPTFVLRVDVNNEDPLTVSATSPPGTLDMDNNPQLVSLAAGASLSATLYDVQVVASGVGIDTGAVEILAQYDSVSPTEWQDINLEVWPSQTLFIVASSTPLGPIDTALSTELPNSDESFSIRGNSSQQTLLVMKKNTAGSFEQIGSVAFETFSVPEPSSLFLLLFGVSCRLSIVRRHLENQIRLNS